MKTKTFSTTNLTPRALPHIPYRAIKESILGKKYCLSLVFAQHTLSKKLNARYRRKRGPANVLSFTVAKNSGEIFIDMAEARREATLFHTHIKNRTALLFIHALFHLKGYRHSSTMEKEEKKIQKRFLISH